MLPFRNFGSLNLCRRPWVYRRAQRR